MDLAGRRRSKTVRMSDARFVSGFVSLIGRPNTGKSTLINSLVGHKVAIVADKPQTTRAAIQGIWNAPNAQIVFVDTPGIHESQTLFNRRMTKEIRAAIEERDLLLYVADAGRPFREQDQHALRIVAGAKTPAFLVLNKIDLLAAKARLLAQIDAYRAHHSFEEYIPVSALTGEGLDTLRAQVLKRLPKGPAYFPPELVTDQPERFLAAEIIREKILQSTREEVPHAVAVVVEEWNESRKLTRIHATIYVEREGQKAIIIGSKGAMLKRTGTLAREELESLLVRKIFLELHVKVRPNWRQSPEFLNALDWRTMLGGEQA